MREGPPWIAWPVSGVALCPLLWTPPANGLETPAVKGLNDSSKGETQLLARRIPLQRDAQGNAASSVEPGVTFQELSLLAPRLPENSTHSLPSTSSPG